MNKKYVYLLIISIIAVIGVAAFVYNRFGQNNNNSVYDATRTSQNTSENTEDAEENTLSDENENITEDEAPEENTEDAEKEKATEEKPAEPQKETEISSFTTKIYTKDSDRQNNISIACSTLNDTTVENGKTFSFTSTVGKATSGKGYKKADVFKNGDVIEALGGGLCQVSTTLYNAVLKVSDIKVTERHSHSNKVPYISSGKDAAVSYGTYDLKFVNNTGNTIKIQASNTKNNVTIKILKLE